ncbi:unnamed protein product [Paramecium octaurelia]|uniref:Cyclic nucleotide-binding domain-containing protein n=1 Tax=Paramecium octaurelia TaxID=43137 RepID=A0A8S1Y3M0_PAROT|nr:unnamed protein product [Paramecium octaurelia]
MNAISSAENNLLWNGENIYDEFSRPFGLHLQFCQLEDLQKNTYDDINALSSPTINRKEVEHKSVQRSSQGSVFRFLKILQKKTQQLKENRNKLSFFQKIYQEKILHSEYSKQQQTQSKYVFDPTNLLALVFQFLKCLVIFLLLVIITYFWSFDDMRHLVDNNNYFYIVIVLLIDISLQFNLAIIIRGQIIYDRIIIFKKYISRQFFEDSIFLVSLVLIIHTSQLIFVIIFYINGIGMLVKIIRKLEDTFDLSVKTTELLKLWKLLFFINLLAHFIACIWHYIGLNTIDANNNWLDSKQIRDESNFIKYIYSFYWSVVTMVTVGYGDITPQNYIEMILCVIIMFLSCGVYAYSLNTIGQIISILNHESDRLERSFKTLNKYFRQHNIKDELQSRIKNYLEYKLKEEEKSNQSVYKILDQLSNHLRFKIISEIYQSMLQKCPLLQTNFSKSTLQNSTNLLETLNYEPDDIIINQYTENENALYFIDQGTVEICEQRTKTQLMEFTSGESFGEYEFFTNSQAAFTYKCKSHTRVFKLSRSKLLEILNKEDFEIFHQIKHSFEFNIPVKHAQCIICHQNDHFVHRCKLLYYIPDISKMVIRQQNFKQRREFKQRRMQRENTFSLLAQIQEKQFEYYQQYIQEYSQKELLDDENVIIGADSQITSLMYNTLKASEIQIQQNQMDYGKDMLNKNSPRKLNSLNVKTKQSLPETGLQIETQNKLKKSTLKIQDTVQNQTMVFDRMKDFNQYFSENNYELQIRKYNQNFIERGFLSSIKKRTGRAMRFIQI